MPSLSTWRDQELLRPRGTSIFLFQCASFVFDINLFKLGSPLLLQAMLCKASVLSAGGPTAKVKTRTCKKTEILYHMD